MTRIISGRAGGTVLDVPAKGTRPTSDRVRESLFGALDSADLVAGARVLDRYAGSGASAAARPPPIWSSSPPPPPLSSARTPTVCAARE